MPPRGGEAGGQAGAPLERAFEAVLERRELQRRLWLTGSGGVAPATAAAAASAALPASVPPSALPEVAAVSAMCDAYQAARRRHADVGRAIDHLECQARAIEAARAAVESALGTIVCPPGSEDDLVGVHSVTGAKEPRIDRAMAIVDSLVRDELAKRDTSALQREQDDTGAFLAACGALFECSRHAILAVRDLGASDVDSSSSASSAAPPASAARRRRSRRRLPSCPVCRQRRVSAALTPCGHAFCHACATGVADARQPCPMCRAAGVGVLALFV